MEIEVLEDAEEAARRGAALIAETVRATFASRARAFVALSGGRTPWTMLGHLAREPLPWQRLIILQVDERDCAENDPQRNLAHLRAALPGTAHVEPMPVEAGLPGAATYAARMRELIGDPPVIDLVHLGLGDDGHTASLVPGDSVLEEDGVDVAWTAAPYQGHRRMTMTYPLLNRARAVFWLVTGTGKQSALSRLLAGDPTIPAGRIRAPRRRVIADRAARPRRSGPAQGAR